MGSVNITAPAGVTIDTTPTVSWTDAFGPVDHYDLQIYDLSAGRLLVDETGIAGTTFPIADSLNAQSYFQVFVRAVSMTGLVGDWSNAEYFSIDPSPLPPLTPVLTGPNSLITDTTPTLTWGDSLRAAAYDVLVYSIERGRPIMPVASTTQTALDIESPLTVGGSYQAFVWARNRGGYSEVSAPLVFRVEAPSAVGPAEKSVFTGPRDGTGDVTPRLTWRKVDGALYYRVHLYNVNHGRAEIITNTFDSSLLIADALDASDTYQAFVQAYTPNGFSTFSDPYEFGFDPLAAAPGRTNVRVPTEPTGDTTPTIIWDFVADAASYELLMFHVETGQMVADVRNLAARHFIPADALGSGSLPGLRPRNQPPKCARRLQRPFRVRGIW